MEINICKQTAECIEKKTWIRYWETKNRYGQKWRRNEKRVDWNQKREGSKRQLRLVVKEHRKYNKIHKIINYYDKGKTKYVSRLSKGEWT